MHALDVGDGAASGRSSRGCPCRGSGTAPSSAARAGRGSTPRGVAALLHRDRRDARQRRPPSPRDRDHVAEREHLGVARRASGRARPGSGPRGRPRRPPPAASVAASADAVDAGGPDHGARGDADRVAAGAADRHRRRRRRRPPCARASASRRAFERRHRLARQRSAGSSGSSAVAGLDEQDARRPRCRPRGSRARSVSRASSAIWPAISTPGRPAADHDEREPGGAPRRVGLDLGRLERASGCRLRIVERAARATSARARTSAHSSWPK